MSIVPNAPLLAACSDDQAHGTAGAVALRLGASERGEVRRRFRPGGFLPRDSRMPTERWPQLWRRAEASVGDGIICAGVRPPGCPSKAGRSNLVSQRKGFVDSYSRTDNEPRCCVRVAWSDW